MQLTDSTSLPARPLRAAPGSEYSDSHWHSLYYFNGYRAVISCFMLAAVGLFGDSPAFGNYDRALFVYVGFAYALFGALCFLPARRRRPPFHLQLTLQVSADIAFMVVLMHASGGVSSGLGLLLLATLAGAGLISRGRLALFQAALASIGVLLEQTYQVLKLDAPTLQYVQVGLLSIGYFATAWLAHMLARHTLASERIAAQREIDLANLAQVNQLVIQDMDDGVLVVDERGVIRQRNVRAELLLGPVPHAFDEVRLGDYSPQLWEQFKHWRQNAVGGYEPIRSPLLARPLAVRFVPVGRSRDLGAVIFLQDPTRLQGQARQMQLAALGRLTANIAHEIRNPLSAISHAAELLQEEPGLDASVARLLRIIHDNTLRLDRMVQDVLKLNRRDKAHREAIALGEFVAGFVEQFSQVEKIPAATFALEAGDGIAIWFDRSHLDQVMWNLARNALRHCRRGAGSIRIVATAQANAVNLDVIDDGAGVPVELRSQLFEPFFTTSGSGTGLGLYLAREVCEANDASLEFVETAHGCQFRILCRRA